MKNNANTIREKSERELSRKQKEYRDGLFHSIKLATEGGIRAITVFDVSDELKSELESKGYVVDDAISAFTPGTSYGVRISW